MEQKESPPTNPKQLKRMKKKLGELNRKIRHSKKKNDGLIRKQNSLRREIKELKQGTRQPIERRQGFVECERAFSVLTGAVLGSMELRSRMDVDTFFSRIREELTSLINRELTDLNSARVQMTTSIRFIQEFDYAVEIDRAKKKAIINPQNDDEECVNWAVIAASEIGKDLQHMSNLRKFENNYDWLD